jgi:hypothetical protein
MVKEFSDLLYFATKFNSRFFCQTLLTHSSFQVQAIGHLSIKELAEKALLPILQFPITFEEKLRRTQDFYDCCVQKDLTGDAKCAAALYFTFKKIIELSLDNQQEKRILNIIRLALPGEGPGLTGRLKEYCYEDEPKIVEMEEVALKELFGLPSSDTQMIRKTIWDSRKTLIVNCPNKLRGSNMLAFLWKKMLTACKNDTLCLSNIELQNLWNFLGLKHNNNEINENYLVLLLVSKKVLDLHFILEKEVRECAIVLKDVLYKSIYSRHIGSHCSHF